MNVEIEVTEGDILVINDKRWEITEDCGGLDAGKVIMEPLVGDLEIYKREELQELMQFSGEVRLIREEYLDVYDF